MEKVTKIKVQHLTFISDSQVSTRINLILSKVMFKIATTKRSKIKKIASEKVLLNNKTHKHFMKMVGVNREMLRRLVMTPTFS